MGKLKTKKGVRKRFKVTKKKKVKYSACGKGHLLTGKKRKRLRKLRRRATIAGNQSLKYLARMLPYR